MGLCIVAVAVAVAHPSDFKHPDFCFEFLGSLNGIAKNSVKSIKEDFCLICS